MAFKNNFHQEQKILKPPPWFLRITTTGKNNYKPWEAIKFKSCCLSDMIFRSLPVFKCRQDFRGGRPCHLRARNTKTWTQHKKVKLINQSEIKQTSITTTKKRRSSLSRSIMY